MVKLTRERHIQHILNSGSNQVSPTTSQSGSLKNVDNIVPSELQVSEVLRKALSEQRHSHHDCHSRKLTPHLKGATQSNSPENTRFKEIQVRFGTFCPPEMHLGFYFLVFKLYELIVRVPTVEISKDFQGLLLSSVIKQPSGTFREKQHAKTEDDGRN